MKTSLRVVLFCLALVAALGSVSPDSRGYSTEYWFYDSSDPNVIVGEGWTDCEWRFHLWWGVWKPTSYSFDTECGGYTMLCGTCPQGSICRPATGCTWY